MFKFKSIYDNCPQLKSVIEREAIIACYSLIKGSSQSLTFDKQKKLRNKEQKHKMNMTQMIISESYF